jgi:Zn-dependent protease with chaperone function
MKKAFLSLFLFMLTQNFCSASCTTVEECRELAIRDEFSYLPRYLDEKKLLCQYASSPECLNLVVNEANAILACRIDGERISQMSSFDKKQLMTFIDEYGRSEIPSEVKSDFDKLTTEAEKFSDKMIPWKLSAYNATFINAHAGADSQIMASAGLWTNSPLERDEIAAILAHEVAHVVHEHSLKLGCLALEWTGAHFELGGAMEAFREDFSLTTERGQVWSKLSNRLEYEADAEATRILRDSGFDPFAMARALIKLKPKESGGFSSGSHPDFEARIQAAILNARGQLKQD